MSDWVIDDVTMKLQHTWQTTWQHTWQATWQPRDNTRDNPLDDARDMIPKELRLYVGGDGPARKVLLENKSSNTGLLFQGDVCAELRESNYVQFN